MSVKTIEKQIQNLKDGASESEMNALSKLHNQLIFSGGAEWTVQELTDSIKGDDDVLNGFVQDSKFYESVREIQDGIIHYFGGSQ